MASLSGSTYGDYAACVPRANQHKLQQELDAESDGVNLHLYQIAELLVDWEPLAPYLRLTDVDVAEIKSDNNKSSLKKIDALQRSKSALGPKATYGTYLKIFVENRKKKGALKCAEKILVLLGATGGPSQSSSSAPPQPSTGSTHDGNGVAGVDTPQSLGGPSQSSSSAPPQPSTGSTHDGNGVAGVDTPQSLEFGLSNVFDFLKNDLSPNDYLALALKLKLSKVSYDKIVLENPNNSDNVLAEIIDLWIKNSVKPKASWEWLKQALSGVHPALAHKI